MSNTIYRIVPTPNPNNANLWHRLLDFFEHGGTLSAIFGIGAIVGTFVFTPFFALCVVAVLFAFHRTVLKGTPWKTQLAVLAVLALLLAIGGYFLERALDAAVKRIQADFAQKVALAIGKQRLPAQTQQEGFLVFNHIEATKGESKIVASQKFGFNVFVVNPTEDRVFDGYADTVMGLVDTSRFKDPNAEAMRNFETMMAPTKTQYYAGKIKGPDVVKYGQAIWGTATLDPPPDQQEVENILVKHTTRIYVITWMAWMDSEHNPQSSYDCRWLQNPSVELTVNDPNDLIWGICR
jgi:hypothetical protein